MKPPRRIESLGQEPPARVARAWTYVVLWAGVVLLASNQAFSAAQTGHWLSWMVGLLFEGLPSAELDMVHAMLRKTAHFVEYAVLGFLTHRAFLLTWPRRSYALVLVGSLLLVLACAGMDEGHQAFLPQRTGSVWDAGLDLCGGLFGILAHLVHAHAAIRRSERWAFSLRGTVSS